jgi:hypothetical protein
MPVKRSPLSRPLSEKRLEANRRNAQNSKGPSSPRGRAISSQNARKHSLLPFENPALPAQLTAQYYGFLQPVNETQRRLVDTLIKTDRLGRYFQTLESGVASAQIVDTELPSMPDALASATKAADSLYRSVLLQMDDIRKEAA